jgi:hypothetical protein
MVPTDPQPRSVRAGFNLAATSATYTPQELVAEVQRVLTMLNIYHVQVRTRINMQASRLQTTVSWLSFFYFS